MTSGISPELTPDELLSVGRTHHVHAARATCIYDIARETSNFLHWSRQSDPRVLGPQRALACQDALKKVGRHEAATGRSAGDLLLTQKPRTLGLFTL
ncbi:hypothetical protein GCM10009578_031430 [Streptomyces rhizosphaericus]